MPNHPMTPRILPVADDDMDAQADELLKASILPTANIFTTFVRAPGLFRKWLPFGGKLLNGKLPARERELLILRTAWNCQAEYEWGQHVIIGGSVGISDTEVQRVASRSTEGWSASDATLLTA